ncbi:MAG TPA: glycosyltransferase family 1 protein [Bacteroidota bacterium]
MEILVDLSVLELPATGVAKVVTGMYGAIAARFPDIGLSGVHRRPVVGIPPAGVRLRRLGRFLPAGQWRRFEIPRASRRSNGAILHFPWNGGVPRLPPEVCVITTMHDVLPLTIPGYFSSDDLENSYRQQRQADIDRSTRVITDSEFSKREIMRHLRVQREPVVIPCATSIGEFAPDPAPEEKKYFLYVGGLDPRKSVDSLLRVFYRLSAEGALRSRLVVTGSSRHAPQALVTLLDDGVRRGYVQRTGYVDDRELARLYAGAIALVYPSRYEGFGMPPLEAMTIGCPVIASRMSSIPEVCGDAALYVDPWSEQGLAEALKILEQDGDLRERFGRDGRTRAATFSWGRAADTFVRVLRECPTEFR